MNEEIRNKKANDQFLEQQLKNILKESSPFVITQKERKIINTISNETKINNKNNLTRTNAYLTFYRQHPEIHWAFLAHMVSRNGGYNMSDLKSPLLESFVESKQQTILFHFLERANALIFHDAYPQLLLYKKSKEDSTDYSHLLPSFHVSKFMIPIWKFFFTSQQPSLLTYALITNEQHYVEKHLMTLPFIKKTVLLSFMYLLQEKLGFTHVLFPFKRYRFLNKHSLAGLEVHDFSSVKTRIDTGKKLYSILFSKNWLSSFSQFATKHEHTASRHDYWPHIFTNNIMDDHKIYSPPLAKAWEDVPHTFPKYQDWYIDFSQIKNFNNPLNIEFQVITKNVKHDLKLIKALSIMKELLT